MGPNSRKYKKEYSFELIRISAGDLDSARALLNSKIGRPENILYLSQQSIEKTLKAMLCFQGQPIVHTHDLEVLVTLLSKENVNPPDAHLLGTLNQYASNRRYEEGSEELTFEDFSSCVNLANKVLNWAQGIIK